MSTTTTTISSIQETSNPTNEEPKQQQLPTPPPIIEANIHYYLDNASSADRQAFLGTAKERLRPRDVQKMPIRDVRQHPEIQHTLDKDAFQFVEHQAVDPALMEDEEAIKSIVYEDTVALMKRVTGASFVLPISHVVRKQDVQTSLEMARRCEPEEMVRVRAPAVWAHVDQSFSGALQVLHDNLPPSHTHLAKSPCRWAIINIWRPYSHPVTREPLALCSYPSVNTSIHPTKTSTGRNITEGGDLRAVASILPAGAGISKGDSFEVWNITHNEGHEWWYHSNMEPEMALFIKCYDSKLDGRARLCPHTAFQSPYDAGPARKSFDVRCLVFWEGESEE